MKLFTKTIYILIIFLKTGNLLSANNLFNVNNIEIEEKHNLSSKQLANKAIEKGYNQLIKRILLKKDITKISDISFLDIKELVTYYNISKKKDEESNKINFSITFDKDKIHNLFYKKGISYSDIDDKDFYILPILLDNNEVFIFSNNYFYENWNTFSKKDELIEFILPLENIEIIQKINQSKNNLFNLNIDVLFKEYSNKNIALVFIENSNLNEKKVYFKSRIQGKILSKQLVIKKTDLDREKINEKMIYRVKDEITNLVKSQNLIDIRTPSFLNVNLNLDKKNNLVLLNNKIKNIDLIENIFVQEFNKDYIKLRIKYLGKLDKIIELLKSKKIDLHYINNQWSLKIF